MTTTKIPNPSWTHWHITFGTYGTRLHGDERPTVDRCHNQFGDPFLETDDVRRGCEQARLAFAPVMLTDEQRAVVENSISSLCERGGWHLTICAAGPDHVHLLCAAPGTVHGKQIRTLVDTGPRRAVAASREASVVGGGWIEQGSQGSRLPFECRCVYRTAAHAEVGSARTVI